MSTSRAAHCPLDCPDACSLDVVVEDDRVVSLDGSARNPFTAGYICGKVRSGWVEHMYGEERLPWPAVRNGPKGSGELRRVSWDEALDRVAAALRGVADEHGGEAILPFSYGGSNGLLTQDTTDARLFRRLGASNLARTVCAAPTTAAARGLYGKMPGVALRDYDRAELVVVWGCNPAVSGIHLMPVLQRAQERGATLVVVDPRRNRLARMADLHLAVRPGTDLPVALSILRWMFESGAADEAFLAEHATGVDELQGRAEPWSFDRAADVAGVPAEAIRTLASCYADAEPAVIRAGWGMERNRNGGSAVAAVLALPAVAGKFGVRGGGYTLSNSGAFDLDAGPAAAEPPNGGRTINMNRLGRTLLEEDAPPVKALFVYNCNPAMTMPDQERVLAGLRRDDLFTVVFDAVHTDTVDYADVVLPATTPLEHAELSAGYGAMVLQRTRPLVPAAGEARPNYDVFLELCDRLELSRQGDPRGVDEMVEAILGEDGLAESLERHGIVEPEFGAAPVQFVDVRPRTADGKVHLCPPGLDAEAPGGLYAYRPDPGPDEFPLALISPATKRTISSTLGQLRRERVSLQMHPDDAAERGLEDGVRVRVFNDLGSTEVDLEVSRGVRPGVVFLPKGLWSHNTHCGSTANALAPDALTDVAGGACFNDARVQVEPA